MLFKILQNLIILLKQHKRNENSLKDKYILKFHPVLPCRIDSFNFHETASRRSQRKVVEKSNGNLETHIDWYLDFFFFFFLPMLRTANKCVAMFQQSGDVYRTELGK